MTSSVDWDRVRLAGIVTGVALLAEHVICYDEDAYKKNPRRELLMSNVLGTLTIAAGVALSGAPAEETARHITIAVIGGAFVLAIRTFREQQANDRFWRGVAQRAIGFSKGVRTDVWPDQRSTPPYRGN